MKFQVENVWGYPISYTNIWMENHGLCYSTYETKRSIRVSIRTRIV